MSAADPSPPQHPAPAPAADSATQVPHDHTHTSPLRPHLAPGLPVPYRPAWTLVREIGSGGFGDVWLATHEWKKDVAAVKFCTHPDARVQLVSHEKNVIVRIMRHAGDHPQIVPLLDYDLTGDVPWLMYQYVEGGTLADAVEQWRDLPAPKRLGKSVLTLYGIARALKKVHQLDPPIVHRDLKPANVLMARGLPRITDFGIGGAAAGADAATVRAAARRSEADVELPTMLKAMGTHRYASPEQLFGSAPHPRDDVYALGIIAYQMVLSDTTAAPGTDAEECLRERGAPAALVSLIVRSIAMDPDRRPESAREWERTLKQWMPRNPDTPATGTTTSRAILHPEPRTVPSAETRAAPALPPPTPARTPRRADATAFHLALPGVLLARPADAPDEPWTEVAETPAEVELLPARAYCLRVKEEATEAELDGLDALPRLVPIRHLNLSWCEQLTDAALAHLEEYGPLRELDLTGCKRVTDAGVVRLRRLAALESLSLRWCVLVTGPGLRRLRRLAALRTLDLMGCGELAAAGFEGLSRLPGLVNLNLRWCDHLSDADLVHLHGLSRLRSLNLANCTRVTDAGVAALQAALPRCRIER